MVKGRNVTSAAARCCSRIVFLSSVVIADIKEVRTGIRMERLASSSKLILPREFLSGLVIRPQALVAW